MQPATVREQPGPYQFFMIGLCVYVLVILGATTLFEFSSPTRSILDYIDSGICVLFFADFCVSLVRAPSRWRYLIRH